MSLVSNSPRYQAALGKGEDVVAYAHGLLSGGWATDINYVHKLQAVATSRAVNGEIGGASVAPRSTDPASAATGKPVPLVPANFAVPSS